MKVFITEFTHNGVTYEGPTVVASSFDEAEQEADVYGCVVVGIIDTVVTEESAKEWKRVLH
tara:strand:- start:886 stop:1068 length:183 start_codon:yes stop_codon:yes gene_type:complete